MLESSVDIQSRKKEIRRRLLNRRMSIPSEVIKELNNKIITRLLSLDEFKKAKTVHIYIPIKGKNEVNTRPVIGELLRERKEVVVPVMEFNSVVLHHVYLNGLEDLKQNKWGVEEPVHQEEADVQQLDIIVVPMIGGDLHGNRLGYGKGYYDSFLSQTKAVKIGLLYNTCLVDEIPVESHDVELDILITEKKVIRISER